MLLDRASIARTDRVGGRRPVRDLLAEMPRTVPALGGGICREIIDPLDEDLRGFIAGNGFERGIESATGFVPAAGAIGRKAFGIAIPQQ